MIKTITQKTEIEQLSIFAQTIFIDYYTNLIGQEQSEYMADLFLSQTAINQLIKSGAIFRMIYKDSIPVGFCEYIKQDNRVFLSKLYVKKEYRKLGFGRLLLNDCIAYARSIDIDAIYLTVNKGNINSINVYKHIGFKQIDSVVNDIGNGYVMDDYIMELSI